MEKRPTDRIFDTILQEEVRRLNQHLPKQRRTLAELLKEETPQVSSIDGKSIVMRKEELEKLASLVSKDALEKVRLPIVFIRRSELGRGAFTVLGDNPEAYTVARALGSFTGDFEEYRRQSTPELVVYKPEVSELTRTYHSLIVIGFGVPEDLHGGA
ncbi:DUF61 family protein [Candidatus Bathyarchaeota archaeon]|nr:MAG: DUF61 family protein [Candidatus Bathyarchaeota archaeon]